MSAPSIDTIAERLEHVVAVTEETRDQAIRTNGRVTALEAWRIEEEARTDERARAARTAAEVAAARIASWSRRTQVLVPVSCVVVGAALTEVAQRV